jgi:hypothetical protein
MHTSGSVPHWWQDTPGVDARDLTPEPTWLQRHWDALLTVRRRLTE